MQQINKLNAGMCFSGMSCCCKKGVCDIERKRVGRVGMQGVTVNAKQYVTRFINLLYFAESHCTGSVQVSHFQPSFATQGASSAICPSFIGSNVRDININVLRGRDHICTLSHAQHTYSDAARDTHVFLLTTRVFSF